jgi:hypothetical protein
MYAIECNHIAPALTSMENTMRKFPLLTLPLLLSAALAAQAQDPPIAAPPDFGDRVENRLDNKGDRIDDRLDNKGDRIDERRDTRSEHQEDLGHEKRADWLDNSGDRIDDRLDNKGDRVNDRLDRKGERRGERRDNRTGSHRARRGG